MSTFQTVEQLQAQIASLTAEVERLRALVKAAYREGWEDGSAVSLPDGVVPKGWPYSFTRATLQPKEGE